VPENSSGDRPGRTPDADVLDYLSGSIGVEAVREQPGGLDADEIAELDDLRALLADPNLWVEPRPELEDAVVDAVVAESATLPSITAAPGESAGRSATPLTALPMARWSILPFFTSRSAEIPSIGTCLTLRMWRSLPGWRPYCMIPSWGYPPQKRPDPGRYGPPAVCCLRARDYA